MSDIGVKLRIKYKLSDVPSDSEAIAWFQLARELIEKGDLEEDAGQHAAEALFLIDSDLVLKAEADTIGSLLGLAGTKSAKAAAQAVAQSEEAAFQKLTQREGGQFGDM